jgi:uncharacterized protein DUF4389
MYPVRYEADYVEERNRVRTFFRLILAIPWLILGSVYLTGAMIIAFLAWFALLFTGRYPQSLYDFNAGVLRFTARANAWLWLQTDEWPPFGLEQHPEYPIRLEVDQPLEKYNRWKVFFRGLTAIPVFFVSFILNQLVQLVSFLAWLAIMFTGRQSGGVHNALTLGNAYQNSAYAYGLLLLTETYPPISEQAPAPNVGGGASTGQASAPRQTA